MRCSEVTFFAPGEEATSSLRSHVSFYWRIASDTKISVLGVLVASGASFLLGTLRLTEQENICLCEPVCIHISVSILSILICI